MRILMHTDVSQRVPRNPRDTGTRITLCLIYIRQSA